MRRSIANGFHEVLKTFETPAEKSEFGMDTMFIKFLNDESHFVNAAMIKNFESIMESFKSTGSENSEEEEKEAPTLQIKKEKSKNGR